MKKTIGKENKAVSLNNDYIKNDGMEEWKVRLGTRQIHKISPYVVNVTLLITLITLGIDIDRQ